MRKNTKKKPLEMRFWSKVSRKSDVECWEWIGANSNGYGMISNYSYELGRQILGVHRLSWMIHFGDIPDGLFVCHHCDNRKCVNPHHLFLGTAQDNVHDMIKKGRGKSKSTSRKREKILKHIQEIKKIWRNGKELRNLAFDLGVSYYHLCKISKLYIESHPWYE